MTVRPFGATGQLFDALHQAARSALSHVLHSATTLKARSARSCGAHLVNFRDASILIAPDDQPIAFLLRFGPPHLLEIAGPRAQKEAAATIRGPFKSLIGLLEGWLDSDALLLSGEVSVSGSSQLVLAVRNTVDAAKIDVLHDLTAATDRPREACRLPMRAA
jgi:predicted lipid carrier protein YhbT